MPVQRPRNHGQRQNPRERLAVKEVACDGVLRDGGDASAERPIERHP